MTVAVRSFLAVAILALIACGGSAGFCRANVRATNLDIEQTQPCTGVGLNESTCEGEDDGSCTAADVKAMDDYADCLEKVPACDPNAEGGNRQYAAKKQECLTKLVLTATCGAD
jgi:hypothetical protein